MPERIGVWVPVTGTGGCVGHHLVSYFRQRGSWVRGSDLTYPKYTPVDADEFQLRDLRRWDPCLLTTDGVGHVYAFAAGMGGMGFISSNHAAILRNNALIDVYTLAAARLNGASRYLFSSSAVIELSDKPRITVDHVDGPQGVPGRNSDKRLQRVLRLGPGHPAKGRTAGDLPVARAASQPPLSGPPTPIRTATSSRSGSARLKMVRP
jgi:NAD dependent epimerase/dehydratase family